MIFSASSRLPAFLPLPAEPLDLSGCDTTEVIAELVTGLQLLAVYQQGAGNGVAVAVLIKVAEQLQPPILQATVEPSSFSRSKPEIKS